MMRREEAMLATLHRAESVLKARNLATWTPGYPGECCGWLY
jgi:hypothetical protein